MQNNITHFDDLPEEVKKQFKLEHIHVPLNKRNRSGRTCRNCVHRDDSYPGTVCFLYHTPINKPRACALRCPMFEHIDDQFIPF